VWRLSPRSSGRQTQIEKKQLAFQSKVLVFLAIFTFFPVFGSENGASEPESSRFLDSSFREAVSFDPLRGRSYNRPVLAALSLPADA
jgi:hypothetical protein